VTSDLAPSWEVFDVCKRCKALAGEPCRDMRMGRWRAWRALTNPHRGRKKIKK
jgi:hypothetical protein